MATWRYSSLKQATKPSLVAGDTLDDHSSPGIAPPLTCGDSQSINTVLRALPFLFSQAFPDSPLTAFPFGV